MRLGDRPLGPNDPPIVVAELGVNHDGSVDRAHALIEIARTAGADAVKLQWFRPERLVGGAAPAASYQAARGETDQRAMLDRLALDDEDFATLVAHAHDVDLAAIVTPFDEQLVDRAATLAWDAWKVASPDIVHRPLLERLAADGRPVIVSTGAATTDEVQRAVGWLGDATYALMQCVSMYPCPDDEASLAARVALGGRALGYSDHTTAIDTGALAVANGARLLEKHLTHDRTAAGPDHASSLDGDGFAAFVHGVRRAWRMLGTPEKRVLDGERDVREAARRSIVAARDLPSGHVLGAGDLAFVRPSGGICPSDVDRVLGKRTTNTIRAGERLTLDDVR